jgi:hypothetical protein
MFDSAAAPGAILPVRRDYDPFFAQRMPSLFPDHWLSPFDLTSPKNCKSWSYDDPCPGSFAVRESVEFHRLSATVFPQDSFFPSCLRLPDERAQEQGD